MPLKAGDQVDRYTIVGRLGEGGQAMLFRATDRLNSMQVALKLVSTAGARRAALERLRREGTLLATLRHPSLVRCERAFEDFERQVYGLELDLVYGASLSQVIEGGQLRSTARRWVLHHVAQALAYLHKNGLVHRDVKPDNVLIDETFWVEPSGPSSVKLVDFGIAVFEGNPRPLTSTGAVVGTAPYLAPELIRPETFGDPDNPTVGRPSQDVFAFGVLATELLVNRHPTGLPATATLAQLGDAYEAENLKGNFPVVFEESPYAGLLRGCLALHPKERFPDAARMVAALPPPPTLVDTAEAPTTSTPLSTARSAKPKPKGEGSERQVAVPTRRFVAERFVLGLSVVALVIYAVLKLLEARETSPVTVPRSSSVFAPPSASTVNQPVGLWDHRVTVGEYARCPTCGGGREATTGDASIPMQTAFCPAAKTIPDNNAPMTCVTASQAQSFCEHVGARLPTLVELSTASSLRDRGPCTDEGRKAGGNFYEWTSDTSGKFRKTFCQKDLSTSNPPEASNSDLGFRCYREK